jgi:hypothetical protein
MTAGVDGEDGHRRSRHIRDVTADVGTVAGATDLPVVSSVSATARRHPRRPAPGSVIHASTLAASFDPPAIQTSCPRSNITDLDQPSTKHVALVVRPSPLLVLALQCSLTVTSFHLPGTINAIHFNPVPDQAGDDIDQDRSLFAEVQASGSNSQAQSHSSGSRHERCSKASKIGGSRNKLASSSPKFGQPKNLIVAHQNAVARGRPGGHSRKLRWSSQTRVTTAKAAIIQVDQLRVRTSIFFLAWGSLSPDQSGRPL